MIKLKDIKPIHIYLPDTPEWMAKYEFSKKYFNDIGIENIYDLAGVHAFQWGVKGTRVYLLDGRPEENFYVGDANVGNFLTQYCAYVVMDALDYSHYLYLLSIDVLKFLKPLMMNLVQSSPLVLPLLFTCNLP